MSVNAFYNIHTNSLFVPSALLQFPFIAAGGHASSPFSPYDLGSLGGLVGHEMSHGFDNVGRLFGPNFELRSWWDNSTIRSYKKRADCIGRYYHTYTSAGRHVHSNQTLEEDIADRGGLHLAYLAMRAALPAGRHVEEEQEPLKTFFTSWAQTWCYLGTEKMKSNLISTDPHSPARVRVNAALSQFAPFAQTYRCHAGSKMYNSHDSECNLW
mmetsp:Transcript_52308/g.162373  ORF Transcript_52308/g.162373 Transcript_52308/m.162373 type:complete len:212 (-) Transcript_52308:16-651(-)